MEAVAAAAGLALVWAVLNDVFQSVIVPRPTPSRFRPAAVLVRASWPLWRRRYGIASRSEQRLGIYAPLVVVALLTLWILMLVLGYGLIIYALRGDVRPVPPDLGTAIYFAAESLLTIGYGEFVATSAPTRIAAVAAAATGLGVVALTITYLFSLYASFQRRELLVVTLDARAGAPPSGVTLLETCAPADLRADLERSFSRWEEWSAEVLESHVAHPILAYFRSTHDNESWVSALGALLDAATLIETTLVDGPTGAARMMRGVGAHLVEDLGSVLRVSADGSAGVERAEYDAARERLARAGYALRDADAGWLAFERTRSQYAAGLDALARYFAVPPALWIGDRSPLRHVGRDSRSSRRLPDR